MKYLFIFVVTLMECYIVIKAFQPSKFQIRHDPITTNLLETIVERMNEKYSNEDDSNPVIRGHRSQFPFTNYREDGEPKYFDFNEVENIIPSIRDQENFLQSPWGYQFIAGEADEGAQNFKSESLIPHKYEAKTDPKLPAYCDPPNPCPIGFSADDGCIQRFENTADFSRDYQAAQECICDFAHMMNCPWSPSISSHHISAA